MKFAAVAELAVATGMSPAPTIVLFQVLTDVASSAVYVVEPYHVNAKFRSAQYPSSWIHVVVVALAVIRIAGGGAYIVQSWRKMRTPPVIGDIDHTHGVIVESVIRISRSS
jgi:hypothetical protein